MKSSVSEVVDYFYFSDLDGWKRHGDSFYKAFLTPLEFSDAKASCEDNGGYLANADTPEKNDYIRSLVR